MAIKETFKQMHELLAQITHDLQKAENDNKAAAQRVRTGTVTLEKVAKQFRKESINAEKEGKSPSKSSAKAKATTAKATNAKASAKAQPQPQVKLKPKAQKTTAKPHALSFKKPTAKLPSKAK